MTDLATIAGFIVMGAATVTLVTAVWFLTLDYVYKTCCRSKDFFDVLVRLKKEQRAAASLARAQREYEAMREEKP